VEGEEDKVWARMVNPFHKRYVLWEGKILVLATSSKGDCRFGAKVEKRKGL